MASAGMRAGEVLPFPTLDDAISSKADVWAQYAVESTNGPTYDFLASLLPPLRYVNADFREYPIVLSAPRAAVKARLTSNGSAVNARGGPRSWNDPGPAVTFRVGPDELRFGEIGERVSEPRYIRGYLPAVQIKYQHSETIYEEEAFAAVNPPLAAGGVVFVRFSVANGGSGPVAAQLDAEPKPLRGSLLDESGQTIVWYDNSWRLSRQRLVANLSSNIPAVMAIATRPIERRNAPLTLADYDDQKRKCIAAWDALVQSGMVIETSEPVITNAWRSMLVGSLSIISSNRLNLSAGNQFERIVDAEGFDAAEALLLWGQIALVRDCIPPLLGVTRKGLEFEHAGRALQLLTRFFQVTRDTDLLKAQLPQLNKELQLLLGSRTNSGLLPRQQYAAEVPAPVVSLPANAHAWRGLRDFSRVLPALGQNDQAKQAADASVALRAAIVAALEKSEKTDVEPPFIPIALSGEDEPYDAITATRMGSFWNAGMNQVLGTGVFPMRSERESTILNYMERHGGVCMGMLRMRLPSAFWNSPNGLNLSGSGNRISALLARDEVEKALVGFYGTLAQGFTRDTFISGEMASMTPLDARGRQFHCPPNIAANASWLRILRELLVQDLDTDDDGEPETLRLLFATPRSWLEDQKVLRVSRASTAFGPISVSVRSDLEQGEVHVSIEMPPRLPQKTQLRLRLPTGWRTVVGQAGERTLRVDETGTTELVGMLGKVDIRFVVERQ